MSLPEISRRCLSCGAAVRAGSRFCQQCGKSLEPEAAPRLAEPTRASVPPTGEWGRPSADEVPPAEEWTPPTKEFEVFEQSAVAAGAQEAGAGPMPADDGVQLEPLEPVVDAAEPDEDVEAEPPGDESRAGDLRGRVARVREGTRQRVGRMREEAIVVLEETPDDSGLRFVLAAAALFVVFIVLLFLSTTLLR